MRRSTWGASLPSTRTVDCGRKVTSASTTGTRFASSLARTASISPGAVVISKTFSARVMSVAPASSAWVSTSSSDIFSASTRMIALRSNIHATPPDGALRAHVAAVLLERLADLRGRPVAVVGQHANHHRHAARRVALVGDLLVGLAGELAGALLDGALDVLLRHVRFLGRLDGGLEPHVGLGVAAPVPGGHGDLSQNFREELAALDVRLALLPLDLRPPGMS